MCVVCLMCVVISVLMCFVLCELLWVVYRIWNWLSVLNSGNGLGIGVVSVLCNVLRYVLKCWVSCLIVDDVSVLFVLL